MTRAVFSQVNIVSGDPDATLAFYRLLGVDLPDKEIFRDSSGAFHTGRRDKSGAETSFDIDSVPFAQVWNAGWRQREDLAGKVVVGFKVASRDLVDDIHADLVVAGHPSLQPPFDAFWGARYAIVEDPDGVAVGLMSPVSAAHRSATPTR